MRRSLATTLVAAAVLVPTATATALVLPTQDHGSGPASATSLAIPGPGHGHMMQSTSELAYLRHMVAHHEEAVDAARALARSERAPMRRFGLSIIASQTEQVQLMRGWLASWYPNADTEPSYRPMMRDLSGLSGDQLDRAFLQDMVVHHMAAVMMSQHLLAGGASEQRAVTDLARTIRDEQRAEILWMRVRLGRWFGATEAPGMHGSRSLGMAPHHHLMVR